MDKYGSKIEDLGAYYANEADDRGPEYTDISSIDDLVGTGDRFAGKIYGIEPSAGLTEQTKESMMPACGLDGEYKLATSSTAAMLTELKKATEKKQDIVVTLWRPFWANDAFPVKDLDDPKGATGKPESVRRVSPRSSRRRRSSSPGSRSTTRSTGLSRISSSTSTARARRWRP